MNRVVAFGLALVALGSFVAGTAAQPATPAAVAPEAAGCTRAPRSVESLRNLMATPIPAPASPVAGMPAGQPADAQTTQQIRDAIYGFVACTNAGDTLRTLAFYSEAMARTLLNGQIPPEFFDFLATPTTVEPGAETVILAIGPVVSLGNGTYAVSVTGDDRSSPEPAREVIMYWTREQGAWVIASVWNADFQATPVA